MNDNDSLKFYEVFRLNYVDYKINQKTKFVLSFDFDNTITTFPMPSDIYKIQGDLNPKKFSYSIKTLVKKRGLNNLISKPFLNKKFIDKLKSFKDKHNAKIVVVSYGLKDGILLMLKAIGFLEFVDLVMTPSYFGLKDGFDHFDKLRGKNLMLDETSKLYNIKKERIMLIDNSSRNITIAKKDGYGVSQVVGNNGMNKENVKDIIDFVNKF